MEPGTYDRKSLTAMLTVGSYRFGGWVFNPETGDVFENGKLKTRLTETESETLKLLVSSYPLPITRARVVNRMRILEVYWCIDTVKVVIMRLRRKLGQELIQTQARGYRFNPISLLHEVA